MVLCHFLQFTSAHGHSSFPAVKVWGRQLRHQLFSSACLSVPAAQLHVFIVGCHLSVKNAFVSIFTFASCWYSCSSVSPSPSHFGLRRFITRHRWQQQRGGVREMAPNQPVESQSLQILFWTLSRKDHLITTVLIKLMNHSGAWADLQVRAPSWSWRLHEIASCDLCDHTYSKRWSLNDNVASIFCLHRERGRIRFHRPPWIIIFLPLVLQKNGWSPANLVQHLKRMPSWHPRSILLLAFWCSIWLRISGCCFYLLCSRHSTELSTKKRKTAQTPSSY